MKFDIEDYAEDNLDKVRNTSSGQITATCPWCEKYGSFYIDVKKGHYICFKCEAKGRGFVGVVAQIEGVTYQEARAYIYKKSVEFRRKETPGNLRKKIKGLSDGTTTLSDDAVLKVEADLPEEFIPVFNKGKWHYPSYLKSRGVTKETARTWGLGYCQKGRYAGRIIIPIVCPIGRSFEARDATGTSKLKTLGPKGVDKTKLLLGWQYIDRGCDVVLCEGPFDVIKLWQHGIPALALMGKVLHQSQLSLLFSRPVDSSVVVMLDPEETKASYDVAAQLICHFENVSIAKLPDGVDPGAATRKQTYRAFDDATSYKGRRTGLIIEKVLSAKRKALDIFG